MTLTSRITLSGSDLTSPEDYLSDSLGVIYPDDVTNQHGDSKHSIIYQSPHLPRPLELAVSDPTDDTDRWLFSHSLWNSSLLLAELIERDSLELLDARSKREREDEDRLSFNVRGKKCLELGAGTGLPSIMASLLGAKEITVTDYPSEVILSVLRANVAANTIPDLSPLARNTNVADHMDVSSPVRLHLQPGVVFGHEWGVLTDDFSQSNCHAYDRLFVCDCLWMPWQHFTLLASIAHFLADNAEARCWVLAGFHTGREKMRDFFRADTLLPNGLEVERIWESECDGKEREWSWDREDDISERKRWLAVASLRRPATKNHDNEKV